MPILGRPMTTTKSTLMGAIASIFNRAGLSKADAVSMLKETVSRVENPAPRPVASSVVAPKFAASAVTKAAATTAPPTPAAPVKQPREEKSMNRMEIAAAKDTPIYRNSMAALGRMYAKEALEAAAKPALPKNSTQAQRAAYEQGRKDAQEVQKIFGQTLQDDFAE